MEAIISDVCPTVSVPGPIIELVMIAYIEANERPAGIFTPLHRNQPGTEPSLLRRFAFYCYPSVVGAGLVFDIGLFRISGNFEILPLLQAQFVAVFVVAPHIELGGLEHAVLDDGVVSFETSVPIADVIEVGNGEINISGTVIDGTLF